jgi:tetratricopeptide (TPR) repeat protein
MIKKACLLTFGVAAFAWQPPSAMLRQLFENALRRQKDEFGMSDPRTAQAARDLGLFLRSEGDTSGAHDALDEAVHIDEKALGPAAPQTLADVAELAGVSAAGPAEALWRRAAESSDAKVAARALAVLGQLREAANDPAGAAKFYRRALIQEEVASGRDSARVAVRLNALSRVVDLAEGIALLDRAVDISRRHLGARDPETATLELNLAGLLLKAGHAEQAAQSAAEAMSIFEAVLGSGHQRTAAAATIMAHALQAKGDAGGAERMYRRALEIDEQADGPRGPRTLTDVRTLAGFLREIGKVREAAELEKKMLNGAPR